MKLFYEKSLSDLGDKPLTDILSLWHSLCREKIGADFEVMVGNRKEHHQLSQYNGELNVATPHIIDGQPKLIIWMDDIRNVQSLLLTHEVGHWILKLQGFRGMVYRSNPHSNVEIMLNSLLHHPGVYDIQRQYGQEPEESIVGRLRHSIKLFDEGSESDVKEDRIQRALIVADDYLHCSNAVRAEMDAVLNQKHKLTRKLLKKLLKVFDKYDLLDTSDVEKCGLEVLSVMGLNSNSWEHIDELNKLKNIAADSA